MFRLPPQILLCSKKQYYIEPWYKYQMKSANMNIHIRMKRVMFNHTESVSSTSTEIIEKKSKKLSEEYDLKKRYLHVAPW